MADDPYVAGEMIHGGMVAAPRYIYDPAVIETALAGRRHLRGAVGDRLLAQAPDAFPRARCSPWQIARILSATSRLPGAAVVVDDLERCLEAGLTLGWLTTTSRTRLRSGLAELRTACELLRHGFVIEDLDYGKSQDRVPELAARDGELEVAVEVYAPRDWQRLADLTDDLADHLRHLDVPTDFDIELRVGPLSRFDDEGALASLHPGPVDSGLDNDVHEAAVESVVTRSVAGLVSGWSTAKASHVISSLNFKVEAMLTGIRPARGVLPRREWLIHGWPAGGYAPEGMFDRLVRRRVRHKMGRGQAAAAGLATTLLVVDLNQVPLSDEWSYDFYAHAFEAALKRHVVPDLMGHDAVAFCDVSRPDGSLRLNCAVVADTAPDGLVDLLDRFGRGHCS